VLVPKCLKKPEEGHQPLFEGFVTVSTTKVNLIKQIKTVCQVWLIP